MQAWREGEEMGWWRQGWRAGWSGLLAVSCWASAERRQEAGLVARAILRGGESGPGADGLACLAGS